MRKPLAFAVLAVAVLSVTVPAAAQAAGQTVNLLLQDSTVDPAITGMAIKSDTAKVKAGRVTFGAVNQSKSLVHEVILVRALAQGKPMPYDDKNDKVIESRLHSLGEIGDLKPGAHGTLTVNLKPGSYLLFCNEAGHYKAGMSTPIEVEK